MEILEKKDKAKYLIKSFDNEQYAFSFLKKGEMYFNCPTYYRYLGYCEDIEDLNKDHDDANLAVAKSKSIGDICESTIGGCVGVYNNLPVYCMYTVGEKDTKKNLIGVRKEAFEGFKRSKHCCFVICEIAPFFNRIKEVFKDQFWADYISYCGVTLESVMDFLKHNAEVIFRKSLCYAHQQEYRVVLRDDKINARIYGGENSCKICLADGTPYRGIIKRIGDISSFSKIVPYEALTLSDEKYYYFDLNKDYEVINNGK